MSENKKLIKKYTSEDAKKVVTGIGRDFNNLDQMFYNLANGIIGQYYNADDEEKKKLFPEFNKGVVNALRCIGLDSHIHLVEAVDECYQPFIKKFSEDLIKEYDCGTSAEKAVVQTISNAFVRVIDNSRRLNNELSCRNITPNRNVFIAMLSKQVDRANRQFLSSLLVLKQIKAPTIEMNIKANTAFIAQNQQVNTDKNNEAK